MRIVVNHLTRMKGERICIAGINAAAGSHVRLIAPDNADFTRNLLQTRGGPLTVGAQIDIGKPRPTPSKPMIEDHLVAPRDIALVRNVGPTDYVALLELVEDRLASELLGPSYERTDSGGIRLAEGTGLKSLGVFRKRSRRLRLRVEKQRKDGRPQVTLRLPFSGQPTRLPVTDLRLYDSSGAVLDAKVQELNNWLARSPECWLMLGLTRPWSRDGGEKFHWLQVNGFAFRTLQPE